ncbi:MAG TPA: hypothetical protein ENK18_18060 [Deltaproteobacteria bacterium]|nr:hypothetical protein [Deltaproteobacteria bacterium]
MLTTALLFIVLLMLLGVGGIAAMALLQQRHALKLKDLQLQELQAQAPEPKVDLPAFVDASDPASMAAWKQAQVELDLPR